MALQFKVGDVVDQKLFKMTGGEVVGAAIGDTDAIIYMKVKYTDAEGNIQEGFFNEDNLQLAG
jgi:hypothetical protein